MQQLQTYIYWNLVLVVLCKSINIVQKRKLININVRHQGPKETGSLEIMPKLVRPSEDLRKLYFSHLNTCKMYHELPNSSCWTNSAHSLTEI